MVTPAAHPGEEFDGIEIRRVGGCRLSRTLSFATAQAAEPKHGGILQIYHRETPPSLSIHEEATFSVNAPAMAIFNNLVVYDQHKPQNSMDTIVPELATSWAWSKDKMHADVQAAPRREMARRQAVHRQGREMHLRSAAGQSAGQVPQESAQGLVRATSTEVTINGDDEVTST